MIDPQKPDYLDSPASDQRPSFHYVAAEAREPLVSVVTPYFNTGPVFWETFRAVQRMSLPYWEWLIVDDASDSADSLAQLQEAAEREPRIRVLRQPNGGPAVARNHAVREARGRYLLILDSDDMVEPTFVEKAIWFLETQPSGFAAVSAHNVTFGAKNFLWPHGFDHGAENIRENFVTIQTLVKKDAYLAVGGFDESMSYEHADWDFWLSLADMGLWGYTLPEYLTWYRTQERSLMVEIEGDHARAQRFRRWLAEKHRGLERRFPRPKPLPAGLFPPPERHATLPIASPLMKPEGTRRVLLIAPWLEVGGADRFNLDLISQLTGNGYEFTVVTTLRDEHPWLSKFAHVTPDVFCLHNFLNLADHPRFISYLIESRQIDTVLVSNSEFGYALLPYLRARHPEVALLDYTHMEEPGAPLDGYPGMSLQAGPLLDLRVTNTEHLRDWMVARGGSAEGIEVRRCAVDTERWQAAESDRAAVRAELGIAPDEPVVAFIGRMVAQKRPLFFAEILGALAERGVAYTAVVVGDGDELAAFRRYVRRKGLQERVHALGAQAPERVRQLLSAADVFALPSAQEGLAIALIEAMAMGLVPVAADVGGQRELVTPETGYLIAPGEGERAAYVDALATLLASPDLRARMGQAARACVLQGFDMASLREGMRASLERACAVADERAACESGLQAGPELVDVIPLADAVVQQFAVQDRIAAEWMQGERVPLIREARQVRQRILPRGTRGYAAYESFRQALRALRVRALVSR